MLDYKDRTRLMHMLDYSREALTLVEGKKRVDLDEDRVLNLALVRLLEIIGEAANRITDEFRASYPEIPWLQIVGLRNRLIHGYDSVDFDILWKLLSEELPALVVMLEKILK